MKKKFLICIKKRKDEHYENKKNFEHTAYVGNDAHHASGGSSHGVGTGCSCSMRASHTHTHNDERSRLSGEYTYDFAGYAAINQLAPATDEYPVYVGGVGLNDGDYLANDATEASDSAPASGGYAHYENGVLTLKDYTYEGEGYQYDYDETYDEQYSAVVYSENALEVVLEGENELINTYDTGDGIVSDSDISISGDGSLNITAYEIGILAEGSIEFNGGTISVNSEGYFGIDAMSDVIINDGSITISSYDNSIIASGDVIINDGEISLYSDSYEAIYVDTYQSSENEGLRTCGFILSGGNVTIEAPEGNGIYVGDIYDDEGNVIRGGNIMIEDASLVINAAYDGLEAEGSIIIEGGNVEITNDENSEDFAMFAYDGIELGKKVKVVEPDNGEIKYVLVDEDPDTTDDVYVYTMVDEEGNPAHHVVIKKKNNVTIGAVSSGAGKVSNTASVKTETTTNEDGSVTTTTTDASTGTKTETTTYPDGFAVTVETRKDGTKIATETTADGETTAEITAKKETDVTIPVPDAESITKIVITDEDGNETEVTDFEINDGGVTISVSGSCTVAIEGGGSYAAEKKIFEDVHSAEHWSIDDVDYVFENGLMNGISEDLFAPDSHVTRAMLVTVLYRNEGEPAVNRSIPFGDIDMSAYYASAVIWAQQNGIVNGISETEFAPDQNITREQIATMIYRYAIYKGMEAVTMEENLHFDDAEDISEYAISAMNWAVGSGLIKGKTETARAPLDNATRAEMAAILHRFIEGNQ